MAVWDLGIREDQVWWGIKIGAGTSTKVRGGRNDKTAEERACS